MSRDDMTIEARLGTPVETQRARAGRESRESRESREARLRRRGSMGKILRKAASASTQRRMRRFSLAAKALQKSAAKKAGVWAGVKKVAGKIGGRLIPFVGWGLLINDLAKYAHVAMRRLDGQSLRLIQERDRYTVYGDLDARAGASRSVRDFLETRHDLLAEIGRANEVSPGLKKMLGMDNPNWMWDQQAIPGAIQEYDDGNENTFGAYLSKESGLKAAKSIYGRAFRQAYGEGLIARDARMDGLSGVAELFISQLAQKGVAKKILELRDLLIEGGLLPIGWGSYGR